MSGSVGPKNRKAELQSLRVLPLGHADGSGVARYKLLISRGKLAAYEAQGDNMIHPAVDPSLLGKADFSTTFLPAGFDAQLLRQGMMNCHAGSCELLLEPE